MSDLVRNPGRWFSHAKCQISLQLKCHQYWPMGEDYGAEEEIVFEANNIRVTLLEEQTYDHYIVRQLELENVQASFFHAQLY